MSVQGHGETRQTQAGSKPDCLSLCYSNDTGFHSEGDGSELRHGLVVFASNLHLRSLILISAKMVDQRGCLAENCDSGLECRVWWEAVSVQIDTDTMKPIGFATEQTKGKGEQREWKREERSEVFRVS